jgi:hypothetical protein
LPDLLNVGVMGMGGQAGVYGKSSHTGFGVQGESKSAVGVYGHSEADRGAMFESDTQAQVHLRPRPMEVPVPVPVPPGQIMEFARDDEFPYELPKDGQPGDLLATVNPQLPNRWCTLWLCVAQEKDGAIWAQVLVSPTTHPGTV